MAVFIPSMVVLTSYFGNPLPLSIIAKRVSYGPLYHLDFTNLLKVLGVFFPNRIAENALLIVLLWVVILIFIAIASRRIAKFNDTYLLPVVCYALCYPLFLWFGRTLMFEWYGYLLFPVFLLLIIPAVYRFSDSVYIAKFKRYFPMIGGAILIIWSSLSIWRVIFFQPAYGQGGPGLIDLEQRALYFRDRTPPVSKIFTESIPQIGYISGRHIG